MTDINKADERKQQFLQLIYVLNIYERIYEALYISLCTFIFYNVSAELASQVAEGNIK